MVVFSNVLNRTGWGQAMLGLLFAGLLATSAGLALHTATRSSLTADEPKHVASALYHLYKQRCCLGSSMGPTIALNGVLLLGDRHPGLSHLLFPRVNPWKAGRQFLLAEPSLDETIWKIRLPSIAFLVGLGLIVMAWSRALYGPLGGAISLFLFAFSPALLGYGSLASGDILTAFFMTLAPWSYARFTERPSWLGLLVTGASLGLALCTKHSALVLIPSFVLLGFLARRITPSSVDPGAEPAVVGFGMKGTVVRDYRRSLAALFFHAASLAGILAVAAVFVWLAYGGNSSAIALNGGPPTLPGFADYLFGLMKVRQLNTLGWDSYLLGSYRRGGWWYYFPLVLAVKVPIPALLAFAAAILLTPRITGPGARREAFVWIPAAAFLSVAMMSNVNIGVRHLLPMLPLLHIFAGRLAGLSMGSLRFRLGLLVLGGIWYAAGSLLNHPQHLGYFNEVVGGPSGGYRVAADSNVDWGQDLKELSRYLKRERIPAIRLAYFGPTPPGRYGIRYQALPSFNAHREDPVHMGSFGRRELLVVSVNNLLGIHPSLRDTYGWLRERQPVARPGPSLLVYDVTGDLEAYQAIIDVYEKTGNPAFAALERERLKRALAEGRVR